MSDGDCPRRILALQVPLHASRFKLLVDFREDLASLDLRVGIDNRITHVAKAHDVELQLIAPCSQTGTMARMPGEFEQSTVMRHGHRHLRSHGVSEILQHTDDRVLNEAGIPFRTIALCDLPRLLDTDREMSIGCRIADRFPDPNGLKALAPV